MRAPSITVVSPVFNEIDLVHELVTRVSAVFANLPGSGHRLVVVDDGSSDGTREALEKLTENHPFLVVVLLSRNFGHQAALSAGLDAADGDAVVLMDGDLQDAPEDIPKLLARFMEGYDVAYAQRVGRKESFVLRTSYFLFYRMIATMSGIQLPLDAGDFSIMSRRVYVVMRELPERHRYLRGLRAWVGYAQIGVPLDRAPRSAGESKYSVLKLLQLAFDGLLSFTIVPLRLASLAGALSVLAATGYSLWAVGMALFLGRSPQGFTTLVVLGVFMSGMILLSLGIIGEYVGRIYQQTKLRPAYIVDRVLGRGP